MKKILVKHLKAFIVYLKSFLAKQIKTLGKHLWTFVKESFKNHYITCALLPIVSILMWALLGKYYIYASWHGFAGVGIFSVGIFALPVLLKLNSNDPNMVEDQFWRTRDILVGRFISQPRRNCLRDPLLQAKRSKRYALSLYFWFLVLHTGGFIYDSIKYQVDYSDVIKERILLLLSWLSEKVNSFMLKVFVSITEFIHLHREGLIILGLLIAAVLAFKYLTKTSKNPIRN